MHTDERITEALKQYGSHPIAFSTLQDGMEYFQHGSGYIAFTKARFAPGFPKTTFALGDPVCSDDDVEGIIESFVEEHPRTCFCQVFKPATAHALEAAGFYVNEFGIETTLPLQEYDFSGKSKQTLRTTRNHVKSSKRANISIAESSMAEVSTEAIRKISDGWVNTKKTYENEITFLARQLPNQDEGDVRQFYAFDPNGEMVGFVFFDPIYRDSKVIGYSADILRDRPYEYEHPEQGKRPLPGLLDAIVMDAAEQFKREGKEILALGFSPFYKVNDGGEYSASSFTTWFCQFNYARMNHVYNYKGLSWHKERYKGNEGKVFFASRKKFSLLQIMTLYGACGLHPIKKMVTSPAKSTVANFHMTKDLLKNGFFLFH